MTLTDDIDSLGGLAATHELYAMGWSKRQLSAAVWRLEIIRVRQGWYSTSAYPHEHHRAARVGGRITCQSAAIGLGLWVRRSPKLHVAVPRRASRLRNSYNKDKRLSRHPDANTIVHWTERHPTSDRFVSSAQQILADMVWCQSPEWVVAAADSALRAGLLTAQEWQDTIAPLPRRFRRLLALVDPASQSIIESVMRFRLAMLGLEARTQVRIRGVGHVDLLVGTKLVIELDGWEFHHNRQAFEEDRRHDARLAVLGYRVLRFTYRQLTRRWASVRAAVLACVARGEHI